MTLLEIFLETIIRFQTQDGEHKTWNEHFYLLLLNFWHADCC